MNKRDILDAIECCRTQALCDVCPLRETICDELELKMIKLPEKLVDIIEKEIAEEMTL